MPGSFVHLELNTDDTDRAKEFYRDLFGWAYNEWPMGDSIYWGVKTPEPPGGSIQTNPMPYAPSQWIPYISVDDVHDTVARARSAGAEILVDFMPVGDSGELAILRDPSGATVGLWKQLAPTNGQSSSASSNGATTKKSAKKNSAKKSGAKKIAATAAKAESAPAAKPGKSAKAGKKAGKSAGKAVKAAAPAEAPKAAKGGRGKPAAAKAARGGSSAAARGDAPASAKGGKKGKAGKGGKPKKG